MLCDAKTHVCLSIRWNDLPKDISSACRMDEYTRACQARNGLLRKFDHGDLSSKVLIAKVSQNGSFCTLLNEKGLVTFATLTQLHPQTVITGNILGYVSEELKLFERFY